MGGVTIKQDLDAMSVCVNGGATIPSPSSHPSIRGMAKSRCDLAAAEGIGDQNEQTSKGEYLDGTHTEIAPVPSRCPQGVSH
jgi:hypothetical protein